MFEFLGKKVVLSILIALTFLLIVAAVHASDLSTTMAKSDIIGSQVTAKFSTSFNPGKGSIDPSTGRGIYRIGSISEAPPSTQAKATPSTQAEAPPSTQAKATSSSKTKASQPSNQDTSYKSIKTVYKSDIEAEISESIINATKITPASFPKKNPTIVDFFQGNIQDYLEKLGIQL